jgi:hypothetical protein
MKPFAIVPRFMAEKELRYYGYDESNVVFTSQSNGLMTRALFELRTTSVFFPTIDQRRRDLGYQSKALLRMDGLGCHHIEQFLAERTARNGEVLFLIAHASDQIQPLDLLTFAMMKQTLSASKFDRLMNPQSNKVVRMLDASFVASALDYNVEAFMFMGLILVERDGRFFLTVHTEKA